MLDSPNAAHGGFVHSTPLTAPDDADYAQETGAAPTTLE